MRRNSFLNNLVFFIRNFTIKVKTVLQEPPNSITFDFIKTREEKIKMNFREGNYESL